MELILSVCSRCGRHKRYGLWEDTGLLLTEFLVDLSKFSVNEVKIFYQDCPHCQKGGSDELLRLCHRVGAG